MYLAELAYQASPTLETLRKWDKVLTATAEYMASYAWKNESSGYYDLGPPYASNPFKVEKALANHYRSYGVTENTPPSETLNLAYEVYSPLFCKYCSSTNQSNSSHTGTTVSPWPSNGNPVLANPSLSNGPKFRRTSPPCPRSMVFTPYTKASTVPGGTTHL